MEVDDAGEGEGEEDCGEVKISLLGPPIDGDTENLGAGQENCRRPPGTGSESPAGTDGCRGLNTGR